MRRFSCMMLGLGVEGVLLGLCIRGVLRGLGGWMNGGLL